MHLARRLVTLLATVSLLQLVLTGSGAPCDEPMPDAGPHAAHATSHDGRAQRPAAEHADHASRHSDESPASDCGVRACTISPMSTSGGILMLTAAPIPTGAFPAIDASALSALPSLDPPPPRA